MVLITIQSLKTKAGLQYVYLCLIGERGGEGNGAASEKHMENAANTQHGIRRASSTATYDIPISIHFTISLTGQQQTWIVFFPLITFIYTALMLEPYVRSCGALRRSCGALCKVMWSLT